MNRQGPRRTMALVLMFVLLWSVVSAAKPTAAQDSTTTRPTNSSTSEPEAGTLSVQSSTTAGAIISNGTVQLGVNPEGHLNVDGGPPSMGYKTTYVGLRYMPTNADSLAPGCHCEGWGAADAISGTAGYAGLAWTWSPQNMTLLGFNATGSEAQSAVRIGDHLTVTHHFRPSVSPNLYEIQVTIRNRVLVPVHALYRRVMDWDVEPTHFWEYVTINGQTLPELAFTSDDGFSSPDPLSYRDWILATGYFNDSGPEDHGALFDFDFGNLNPGETRTFSLFYGAAATEQEARDALLAVGAQTYSLAKPGSETGLVAGAPNTFIFGYANRAGDRFEANDTIAAATTIGADEDFTDLTIHTATDVDFFRIASGRGGLLDANLAPPAGRGYRMTLYDRLGNPVGEPGVSSFAATLAPESDYYIKVYSSDGSSGAEAYSLTLSYTPNPLVLIDLATAAPVARSQPPLTIYHTYDSALDYLYWARSLDEPWVYHRIEPTPGTVTVRDGELVRELLWDYRYYHPDKAEWFPVMEGNWQIEVVGRRADGLTVAGQSGTLEVTAFRRPIIFVPGVAASFLIRCTRNCADQDLLWPAEGPHDTAMLELNADGSNKDAQDIRPNGPILSILHLDFGRGLLYRLEQLGWADGVTLHAMDYDWRQDVTKTAEQLQSQVELFRLRAGSRKANLVAHSMGGLVSKYYLLYQGGSSYVDTFISIGTPYLGAPKAYKAMAAGDDMGVPTSGEAEIEQIADTLPSVNQLLPSEQWFMELESSQAARVGYIDTYGPTHGTLTYSQTMLHLSDFPWDVSQSLYRRWNHALTYGTSLHKDLDGREVPGVKRHAIVGMGQGTLHGIGRYESFLGPRWILRWYDGDGTVPTSSAEHPGGERATPGSTGYTRVVYVLNTQHSQLPGAGPVIEYAVAVLFDEETAPLPTGVFFPKPPSQIRGEYFTAYCPVEVHIYDQAGNHTGPTAGGNIERNVPGVEYYVFADQSKHWFLPEGQAYSVVMQGTDLGTLDLHVSRWEDGEMVQKEIFNKVALTADTMATMQVTPMAGEHVLTVQTPAGTQEMAPHAVIAGAENLVPTQPPVAVASLQGTQGDDGWYTSDVSVTLSAEDQGNGVLSIVYKEQDEDSYQPYTGAFVVTTEGTTTLLAGATDRLGFDQPEPTTVPVKIDKTDPSVTSSASGPTMSGWYTGEVTVSLAASDTASGVREIRYLVDGGPVAAVPGTSASFTLTDEGAHEIRYWALDVAGNVSSEQLLTIRISVPSQLSFTGGWNYEVVCYPEAEQGTLSWTSVTGALGYRLYRSSLNGTSYLETTVTSVFGCFEGGYSVTALLPGGEGPPSNYVPLGTNTFPNQ